MTPTDDGTAGCFWDLLWPAPGDCAHLYEETFLDVEAEIPATPEILRGQVLYQLIIDDALVGRTTEAGSLWSTRAGPACARTEAIHLGNGESIASAEGCTSAELAAELGVHLRDVAAELTCDASVVCSSDEDG